jgi:hypothetical protein
MILLQNIKPVRVADSGSNKTQPAVPVVTRRLLSIIKSRDRKDCTANFRNKSTLALKILSPPGLVKLINRPVLLEDHPIALYLLLIVEAKLSLGSY